MYCPVRQWFWNILHWNLSSWVAADKFHLRFAYVFTCCSQSDHAIYCTCINIVKTLSFLKQLQFKQIAFCSCPRGNLSIQKFIVLLCPWVYLKGNPSAKCQSLWIKLPGNKNDLPIPGNVCVQDEGMVKSYLNNDPVLPPP